MIGWIIAHSEWCLSASRACLLRAMWWYDCLVWTSALSPSHVFNVEFSRAFHSYGLARNAIFRGSFVLGDHDFPCLKTCMEFAGHTKNLLVVWLLCSCRCGASRALFCSKTTLGVRTLHRDSWAHSSTHELGEKTNPLQERVTNQAGDIHLKNLIACLSMRK